MDIILSWNFALQYGTDSCTRINQGLKLRERQISLTPKKERKKEKSTPSGSARRQRFPITHVVLRIVVVNHLWRRMEKSRRL